MAVRKSKEQKFQVKGKLDEVREKCVNALNSGGFKKIENNSFLNQLSAKYTKA